jgi:uncharacterized protein
MMSEEVVLAALALASASGLSFHVQLAGGEPTLEPALIEFVGRTVRQAGWPATIAVQTNGTLIDKTFIDLCRRYDITIGVSLDGPLRIHDHLRGKGAETLRGLALLEKESIPVRVTSVLSSENTGHLHELAMVLAKFANIRGFGFDPLIRKGMALHGTHLFPSAEEVAHAVAGLMDAIAWINGFRSNPLSWRELDAVRQALSNDGPRPQYCHACIGEGLAIHPDGSVFPCAQAIGDPAMAAGSVREVDWGFLRTCLQDSRLHGACDACPLQGRCPGDCPSRLRYNHEDGTPIMCVVYEAIAERIGGLPSRRSVA